MMLKLKGIPRVLTDKQSSHHFVANKLPLAPLSLSVKRGPRRPAVRADAGGGSPPGAPRACQCSKPPAAKHPLCLPLPLGLSRGLQRRSLVAPQIRGQSRFRSPSGKAKARPANSKAVHCKACSSSFTLPTVAINMAVAAQRQAQRLGSSKAQVSPRLARVVVPRVSAVMGEQKVIQVTHNQIDAAQQRNILYLWVGRFPGALQLMPPTQLSPLALCASTAPLQRAAYALFGLLSGDPVWRKLALRIAVGNKCFCCALRMAARCCHFPSAHCAPRARLTSSLLPIH